MRSYKLYLINQRKQEEHVPGLFCQYATKADHYHHYPSFPGSYFHSISVRVHGSMHCTNSNLHAGVAVRKGDSKPHWSPYRGMS